MGMREAVEAETLRQMLDLALSKGLFGRDESVDLLRRAAGLHKARSLGKSAPGTARNAQRVLWGRLLVLLESLDSHAEKPDPAPIAQERPVLEGAFFEGKAIGVGCTFSTPGGGKLTVQDVEGDRVLLVGIWAGKPLEKTYVREALLEFLQHIKAKRSV